MNKKEQLLAWELENKQLDVEIKEEQLLQARLKSGELRKQIETQALLQYDQDLAKTCEYQHGQIQRLRWYINDHKKEADRLSKENVVLTQERNFIQDDLKNVRAKLSELRNTPVLKFVSWVRNLFSPGPGAPTCIAPTEKKPPVVCGSRGYLSTLSPEVARMSADEFKKKYIDPIVLVDPAAL